MKGKLIWLFWGLFWISFFALAVWIDQLWISVAGGVGAACFLGWLMFRVFESVVETVSSVVDESIEQKVVEQVKKHTNPPQESDEDKP